MYPQNAGKLIPTPVNVLVPMSVLVPAWATLIEPIPDPAVVTDARLRNAIIASGFAWRIRDNSSNIEMLLVPPGTFQMGKTVHGMREIDPARLTYADDRPDHTVTLTNAYYLGRYAVTQAQWQAKMGLNPSYFQGQADSPSRPVERVTWYMIQLFLSATGLRLPTEAEWEFACRAGTMTPFHSGPGFPHGTSDEDRAEGLAWSFESEGTGEETHAVGGKAANALGFHDMLGNVWEWCDDFCGVYSPEEQTNPAGPESGDDRVLRGGGWTFYVEFSTSSCRYALSPESCSDSEWEGAGGDVGFRVARAPS